MDSPKKVERNSLRLPTLNFGPISPQASRANAHRRTRIFDHKPLLLSRFEQMEIESNSEREEQSVYAQSAVMGDRSDEFQFKIDRLQTELLFKDLQIKKIRDDNNLKSDKRVALRECSQLQIQCDPISTFRSNRAFSKQVQMSFHPVKIERQGSVCRTMSQSYSPPTKANQPFSVQTVDLVQITNIEEQDVLIQPPNIRSSSLALHSSFQENLQPLPSLTKTLDLALSHALTISLRKRSVQQESQTKKSSLRRVGQVQITVQPELFPSLKVIQLQKKIENLKLQLINEQSVNNMLISKREKPQSLVLIPQPPRSPKKPRKNKVSLPQKKSLMDTAVGTIPQFKLVFYLIAILTAIYRLFSKKGKGLI